MSRFIEIECWQCKTSKSLPASHVNRSTKQGMRLFCSRACAGLARRCEPKTDEQKKAEKAEYDRRYRERDGGNRKAKKAAYYARTKDRAKEAEVRKRRMPKHVEYCRRPEYVAWKREYDKVYRAKTEYGEFWEAAILALEIRQECLSRMSDYDIRISNGTMGKTQKRKREHERSNRKEPEIGPLGNLELGQRR